MINPSFEELEKINISRYAIVVMTSKRSRRLVDGSKPLINTKNKKPVSIAIEEIMEGKVVEEKVE